jgi:ATP-dependent Zn protease
MATAEPLRPGLPTGEAATALAGQWRSLTRAATFVAVVTSPAVFLILHREIGWNIGWSLVATVGAVAAFRGLIDLGFRRVIPWPSLFGTDDARLMEEDVVGRRRAWFWRKLYGLAWLFALAIGAVLVIRLITVGFDSTSVTGTIGDVFGWLAGVVKAAPQLGAFGALLAGYFLFNFMILLGPMLLMGISQIRGFEPGDADWGVRLADVRGQAEAKEEVRRIVSLWQSGEAFEKAGGKRERGILFLGAPGTGKTMLAKAIATGFNSPFVSIPGSGFAQTFIGIDAIIVRFLARKAKRLARKWGGQCIVFIDEIDAVGMRRSALGTGGTPRFAGTPSLHDYCFFGPNGALNPSGDLILETRAWRERLFALREPERLSPYPPFVQRLGGIVNQGMPGMMGGGMGQLALNQLLVTMDGIDNPPLMRRVVVTRVNTILDALYVVPRRLGRLSLRLAPPRPRREQIYFIGATNAPIEALDPALTRPGRLGRHVWFRTPTKRDRQDIFDLYLDKVDHDSDLDRDKRRDELARVTNGYSPAMIEQVCSMALTHAHHEGRERFRWDDLLEAMTTVESGTAVGVDYIPDETRAVAIHEAGHAATAHVFMKGVESTRLSIKMRAGSLGHHQAAEKEERFSSWRHEDMGRLAWALGAMAAERVFYGENSRGVGGDVQTATTLAAMMVGAWGMAPEPVRLNGSLKRGQEEDDVRAELMGRFRRLGTEIMNRTGASTPYHHDEAASVLSDPEQRRMVAEILGQAYVQSYNLIANNREAVEKIADQAVARREIYGDELVELLDSVALKVPEVDLLEESSWPAA